MDTYPAIEFLRQRDFSHASVFEYGCGHSTLFWSAIARRVVSVEDDEHWYAAMQRRIPSNSQLLHATDLDQFVATIDGFDRFDVVAVDGPVRGRTRLRCAEAALRHLRPGGMIILDNSDWLPASSARLRAAGLLQIDITGFSPINSFTGCTSFFFDRSWDVPPKESRLPVPGPGAKHLDWETQPPAPGRQIDCDGEVIGGVELDVPTEKQIAGEPHCFRIVGYGTAEGTCAIAIIDTGRGRLLLRKHHPQPGPSAERSKPLRREVERLVQMPGDASSRSSTRIRCAATRCERQDDRGPVTNCSMSAVLKGRRAAASRVPRSKHR